ncbi:lipoyl(octanoyl) transferase LipB [Cryobacterium sp. TMT1-3]|uniref:Octanoyltransferase n=1 Tax=Cryobacterium luteum TaxID=1424661 RepID=A0A1H8DBX1_9MICO|nr:MULTISPECIES: lipoyl(octanoyl) transferase LipB [Cryobacterium]TFB91961.1 lipoyl(octanoyl) transferase LipB [Cryobacterium luteum]TFC31064.1 lipoyl(octanoyl) transferase LipB [Cryobacterium sp. TMT1-3]SEN04666.1 lipoyl(octanoyl) transferase [Cryobacterium luteum]
MLDFVVAGLSANSVPYVEGLELQRAVHRSVVAGERPDTVLLMEHPAVYTAGKRTLPEERPIDDTPVIDADRGGKITWHGPGQLVGYPIVHLQEPVDVVGYVRCLEGILIEVLIEFGIGAVRVPGRSGVWVGKAGHEDKIAAIGIRVAQGVTMHGFALNCSNSLEPYSRIIACGIRDAGVTTMTRVLGHSVDPAELIDPITNAFRRAPGLHQAALSPASLETVRTNA